MGIHGCRSGGMCSGKCERDSTWRGAVSERGKGRRCPGGSARRRDTIPMKHLGAEPPVPNTQPLAPSHPHSAVRPNEPQRIRVIVKEGRPWAVIFKGRRLAVTEIVNMWRVDEEWWRKPISRMYYHVELQNHVRLSVFRDLYTGIWYRQKGA